MPPVPPHSDSAIGLEFYVTRARGAPGRLKSNPESFRVTEVSAYPHPDADGAFVVGRVVSRDWEQHELGSAIARRWGLAPSAIRWAGTKDRRAVSERLFSFHGQLPPTDLALPRVELRELYRAREGLVLGHHFGNAFDIRVDVTPEELGASLTAWHDVAAELREGGGFANFFGPQRFGEVRPVTHEVGRWLLRGDPARAVEVYLTERPAEGAAGPGDLARAAYAAHHDPRRALVEFPHEYRFELALLERLARGDPPERALRALPRELRLLFVHAFQAYLFNRWLGRRVAAGLPLDRPEAGDRILRVERNGSVRGQEAVPVEADNRDECSDLVGRGRAWLAGPLVGDATPRAEGVAGEILEELLRAEGVDRAMFRLPRTPELASRGTWRPAWLPLPPLGIAPDGPDGARFRFALPKGAYATVLLREFLKAGSVSDGTPAPA